ncbi:hypothetical protein MNVM_09560 [Mycobacterium novum]|nr:hypothetical protein MNVM_09560 [Mycobacterium novum]GFG83704.1 hypothetical protein MALGJ_03800 [Mycolicibacter algericus]
MQPHRVGGIGSGRCGVTWTYALTADGGQTLQPSLRDLQEVSMKTQTCLPAQSRGDHGDYMRAVHLLRAAASSDVGQSDARRQWIRAATRC